MTDQPRTAATIEDEMRRLLANIKQWEEEGVHRGITTSAKARYLELEKELADIKNNKLRKHIAPSDFSVTIKPMNYIPLPEDRPLIPGDKQ